MIYATYACTLGVGLWLSLQWDRDTQMPACAFSSSYLSSFFFMNDEQWRPINLHGFADPRSEDQRLVGGTGIREYSLN